MEPHTVKLSQYLLSIVLIQLFITPAFGRCSGEPEIPTDRSEALRRVVGVSENESFEVLSETLSQDGNARFVLYSTFREQHKSVHLASTSLANGELSFTYDVSRYIPQFSSPHRSEIRVSQAEFRREESPRKQSSGEVLVDGCVNALTLKPAGPAVHMNLFAQLEDWDGANDVIFVIQEDGVIQPLLELSPTTTVFRQHGKIRSRSDSVIAALTDRDLRTEIIWKLSTQLGNSIAAAGYFQYALYQWDTNGFRKSGSRDFEALEARTRAGLQFRRCSRIEPVNVEYKVPAAN